MPPRTPALLLFSIVAFGHPATFVKPWHVNVVWDLVPDDEIQEFVCENNRDPIHTVNK